MLKSKSGGQSGTLVKERGSHDLDSGLWGIEGLPKRPRCIGARKGWNPFTVLFYSVVFT